MMNESKAWWDPGTAIKMFYGLHFILGIQWWTTWGSCSDYKFKVSLLSKFLDKPNHKCSTFRSGKPYSATSCQCHAGTANWLHTPPLLHSTPSNHWYQLIRAALWNESTYLRDGRETELGRFTGTPTILVITNAKLIFFHYMRDFWQHLTWC